MQVHLTKFTVDRLRLMRSRRVYMAFSSSLTISFRARICPSLWGVRERANRNASDNAGAVTFKDDRLFRHRGPLHRNRFVDMAPDQVANLRLRFSRKTAGQHYNRADCAGLAIDRHLGAVEVVKDLKDDKYN